MSRVQINDLPVLEGLSSDELKGIFGGIKLGKFQAGLGAAIGAGAAGGAINGSLGGPIGTAAGAIGGAVIGGAIYIGSNHADKKWSNGGLKNWKNPKRW